MRVADCRRLRDDRGMLLIGQTGYENLLAGEIEAAGLPVAERGPGWVRTEGGGGEQKSKGESLTSNVQRPIDAGDVAGLVAAGSGVGDPGYKDLAFAHLVLIEPVEITGESVNALAQRVADVFLTSLRGERVGAAWPCVWAGPHEIVGLGRRVSAVEAAFGELLRKKLSRVAKLAVPDLPRGVVGGVRGLFVFFPDFRRAFVARAAWLGGQRRMADDELAPSRSYLKIEEAYAVLGREPQAGELVVDLGAAPGGWSYSAAKRGARVIAVDNGPLKGGALNHPLIGHRIEDAFGFRPGLDERGGGTPPTSEGGRRAQQDCAPTSEGGSRADWLFCDLVEEPHHVLRNLVTPWLEGGWCRRFVVNLKLGHVDALALLRELRAPESVFSRCATGVRVRHLYHDREELTVVGETRAGGQ